MKATYFEYMDDPEEYLDDEVNQHFRNKYKSAICDRCEKYHPDCVQAKIACRRLEQGKYGLEVREQMKRVHNSMLKKQYGQHKRFCESYEQRQAAEPSKLQQVRERLDLLMEFSNDGLLVNEVALSRNEEERLAYSAFDTCDPKKRGKLKKEFQDAFKSRSIRLSDASGAVGYDGVVCTANPPKMVELPVKEVGKFRIARVSWTTLMLIKSEVIVA